jgi:hypothetical protein
MGKATEMITRPSTLTPEEMEKLLERLANHGARITMADPRVTSFQTWILVTMGGVGIAVGGWGIKSINDLNQNMAAMLVRYEYDTRRVERIERHLETVDGRVVVVEKKVLR